MLSRYFKESFHWLQLFLFKPLTFLEGAGQRRSERERLFILLPAVVTAILALQGLIGGVYEALGYDFDWFAAFSKTIVYGLVGGLGFGLSGLGFDLLRQVRLGRGLVFELQSGLVYGLLLGLLFGLGIGLTRGLVLELGGELGKGLVLGLIFGLLFGSSRWIDDSLGFSLFVGFFGLVLGLVHGPLGLHREPEVEWLAALQFLSGYFGAFLFIFLRPFYLPLHAVQYWRARQTSDPFPLFQNSPVYWDEVIALPLPYLTSWLVKLVESDRERGLAEIRFVAASRPYQRRTAQKALIILALRELEQLDSLGELATAGQVLQFVPIDTEYLPRGFADARHRLDIIAQTVQDYLTRVTLVGRMNILQELQDELGALQKTLALIGPPVGPSLQSLASRWLRLVEQEQTERQKQLPTASLPNPFVAGNPLRDRDHDLFKGRRDIIAAIEEHIINTERSATLLLYGRRRIGKTSTLLNLPRLLGSQFVPVFIDLQEAKWRESDAVFCYQLVRSLTDELRRQHASLDLKEPQLEQFERYPFTALDEALDNVEEASRQLKKPILLTLDEYERLEEGLKISKLSTAILDQLRHIVQHREDIAVLFSGSHRFEELHGITWSDYLINVKTLELSFLPAEDARELLTEPVPELVYQPDAIEKVLALTHCQPYLLQAVAFELVNSLNSQNKLEARVEDIEVVAGKVLGAAQAYFYYTWQEECSEQEKAVLWALAANGTISLNLSQDPEAVRSLCHKDILENVGQQHRFTIELFRRWIVRNQDISGSVRQSA